MRKSDTRCESKQECSSSKADELKVEFSAEWLRIWRYERGIYLKSKMNRNKLSFGLKIYSRAEWDKKFYLSLQFGVISPQLLTLAY